MPRAPYDRAISKILVSSEANKSSIRTEPGDVDKRTTEPCNSTEPSPGKKPNFSLRSKTQEPNYTGFFDKWKTPENKAPANSETNKY